MYSYGVSLYAFMAALYASSASATVAVGRADAANRRAHRRLARPTSARGTVAAVIVIVDVMPSLSRVGVRTTHASCALISDVVVALFRRGGLSLSSRAERRRWRKKKNEYH